MGKKLLFTKSGRENSMRLLKTFKKVLNKRGTVDLSAIGRAGMYIIVFVVVMGVMFSIASKILSANPISVPLFNETFQVLLSGMKDVFSFIPTAWYIFIALLVLAALVILIKFFK